MTEYSDTYSSDSDSDSSSTWFSKSLLGATLSRCMPSASPRQYARGKSPEDSALVETSKDKLEHAFILTNPHAWYRHPLLRLLVLFLVLFMDFFTYGMDPSQVSFVEYTSAGTGHFAGLTTVWWAPNWLYGIGKMICLIFAIVVSIFTGRLLRKYVFVRLIKWKAFKSDGGIIMCCVLMFLPAVFVGATIYDLFIRDDQEKYLVGAGSMHLFEAIAFLPSTRCVDIGHMWQGLSATLDWISIWQIGDSIFQDTKFWPNFMPGFKRLWNAKCGSCSVRTMVVLFGLPTSIILTIWLMANTSLEGLNWEVIRNNEVHRGCLSGLIVFLDLSVIVQDWEFPLFCEEHHEDEHRTHIAGTNVSHFDIHLPCCKTLRPLRVSQKWLQYGPLVGVMGADFAFLKAIITYTPQAYGQYVDPNDFQIWSVRNTSLLDAVYPLGVNRDSSLLELISFSARQNSTGVQDWESLSMYIDSSWDYIGLVMGLCFFCGFLTVLRFANHDAIEEHVNKWGHMPEDTDDEDGSLKVTSDSE